MQEKLPELRLFDVIKEVGRGAFSAVFVAGVKNHPGVKVALKKIKQTSLITNAVNETRFLQRFKYVLLLALRLTALVTIEIFLLAKEK